MLAALASANPGRERGAYPPTPMSRANTDKARLTTPRQIRAVGSPARGMAGSPVTASESPAGPGIVESGARAHERRVRSPLLGGTRRRRLYIPLRVRVVLTFAAGLAWVCFSLWLSRHWIAALGRDISAPAAFVLV